MTHGTFLDERAHVCGRETARSTAVGHASVNAAMCGLRCDNRAIGCNRTPRKGVLSHLESGNEKLAVNVSALKRALASPMSENALSAIAKTTEEGERKNQPKEPTAKQTAQAVCV